jgi:hypothetical protein
VCGEGNIWAMPWYSRCPIRYCDADLTLTDRGVEVAQIALFC